MAQDSQRPGDHQYEIGVGLNVQKRPERVHRPARSRKWQWLHAGRAAEAYRRLVDHPPAGSIDLHRPPCRVRQVEINAPVGATDAE